MTWRRMGPPRAIKHYSGYNLHLGKSLHRYLLEERRIFGTRITQHMLFSMSISGSSQHAAPGTIVHGAVYAHQLLNSNVFWLLQKKVQMLRKTESNSTRGEHTEPAAQVCSGSHSEAWARLVAPWRCLRKYPAHWLPRWAPALPWMQQPSVKATPKSVCCCSGVLLMPS